MVIPSTPGLPLFLRTRFLIAGESDPDTLAGLAHRRVKALPEELREALRGRVTKHHRFLLQLHLQQVDAIDAAISEIDREVDANDEPFRTAITILTTIPGFSELSARVIIAEIGNEMSRFPTAGHLISWAGLCPKNDESAGKRRSTRMRKGAGAVAEDHLDPMCLGRRPQKGQLSPSTVPPPALPPR
jgi:transposase